MIGDNMAKMYCSTCKKDVEIKSTKTAAKQGKQTVIEGKCPHCDKDLRLIQLDMSVRA